MEGAEVKAYEVEDDNRHNAQGEDDGEQIHDKFDGQPGHRVMNRSPAALLVHVQRRCVSATTEVNRLVLFHLCLSRTVTMLPQQVGTTASREFHKRKRKSRGEDPIGSATWSTILTIIA
jgi:hypothetical protein